MATSCLFLITAHFCHSMNLRLNLKELCCIDVTCEKVMILHSTFTLVRQINISSIVISQL